jgi:hypothetical protein
MGNNGSWSPINFKSASLKKGKHKDIGPITWTPVDDKACSLTVCIDPKDDEIIYNNNWAQQIVFDLDSPYSLKTEKPDDINLDIALYNPLNKQALAYLKSEQNIGFDVEVPPATYFEPGETRKLNIKIKPSEQFSSYEEKYKTNIFKVHLAGYVMDPKKKKERRVGGISAWVSFKRRADIKIWKNKELSGRNTLVVDGSVEPASTGKIHVVLSDPKGDIKKKKAEHTRIGDDGKFRVLFKGIAPGQYNLDAHIVYSKDVAKGKSNTLRATIK